MQELVRDIELKLYFVAFLLPGARGSELVKMAIFSTGHFGSFADITCTWKSNSEIVPYLVKMNSTTDPMYFSYDVKQDTDPKRPNDLDLRFNVRVQPATNSMVMSIAKLRCSDEKTYMCTLDYEDKTTNTIKMSTAFLVLDLTDVAESITCSSECLSLIKKDPLVEGSNISNECSIANRDMHPEVLVYCSTAGETNYCQNTTIIVAHYGVSKMSMIINILRMGGYPGDWEGANISVSCHAEGFPKPKYEWTREGGERASSSPMLLETFEDDGWSNFSIYDFSYTPDAGIYRCTATNEIDKITNKASRDIYLGIDEYAHRSNKPFKSPRPTPRTDTADKLGSQPEFVHEQDADGSFIIGVITALSIAVLIFVVSICAGCFCKLRKVAANTPVVTKNEPDVEEDEDKRTYISEDTVKSGDSNDGGISRQSSKFEI